MTKKNGTEVFWEFRADFGWPETDAVTAPVKDGMVAHYDGDNQHLHSEPHSACIAYWKRTRVFHMTNKDRKWRDIGYSWGVCPHGGIMEGRGFGREQAAQPSGNRTHMSCTFMTGPDEWPTAIQLQAWYTLRAKYMKRGGAGTVKGHRDFFSTDCPGSKIYGMVKDGTLRHAPDSTEETLVNRLPELREGVNGFDVRTLRALLYVRGGKSGLSGDQLITWLSEMVFTADLTADVKKYQKARKLDSDGIVGPKTWGELLKVS